MNGRTKWPLLLGAAAALALLGLLLRRPAPPVPPPDLAPLDAAGEREMKALARRAEALEE